MRKQSIFVKEKFIVNISKDESDKELEGFKELDTWVEKSLQISGTSSNRTIYP
ncbi:MAG: hypothetical protein GX307_03780 [Euryarchaeota archaeon]|nr:hypothetical protein [Euryarchaeota archaeon]